MKKMASRPAVVQLSPRGQVTLPAGLRKTLGLESGSTLTIFEEEGRLILEPAAVVAVELYSGNRVDEFRGASALNRDQVARARKIWKV